MQPIPLWREPLLHFLLLGALIFLAYQLRQESPSDSERHIVVSRGQIEQLRANFERTRLRPPTAEEFEDLLEGHIREEVLYREALALGLDRDDPMVRRRLRMKLEFIFEDLSANQADDARLQAFLDRHADRYRQEAKTSFEQIFISAARHADPAARAEQVRQALEAGEAPQLAGDRSMIPYSIDLARESEVNAIFGADFARELNTLSPGSWVGPLRSAYGLHLVKISRRIDSRPAELNEIRDQVQRDYLDQRRGEQKDLAYRKLREAYEITVESGAEAG